MTAKYDSDGKCLTCKGTGKIPLFTSLADCDVCMGRGRTRIPDAVKLIADYIKTPEGRRKLAASMTQPVRKRRDYNSIGRKTFQEPLAA